MLMNSPGVKIVVLSIPLLTIESYPSVITGNNKHDTPVNIHIRLNLTKSYARCYSISAFDRYNSYILNANNKDNVHLPSKNSTVNLYPPEV